MAIRILAPHLRGPIIQAHADTNGIPAPRFTVKIYPAVQWQRPRFVVIATEAHPTPGRIFSAHWTRDEAISACEAMRNCAHRWVLVGDVFICDDCSVRR